MAQPQLWAVLGRRVGDNRQLVALAEASGLTWTPKPIAFADLTKRRPSRAGSFAALDEASRRSLTAPWPDVVLAAGRWSSAVALAIKTASGGRTRLVHIGRPWAPVGWFDLIVTTAQYGLTPSATVIENALPLTPPRPTAATNPTLEDLPRPRLLVIVGGDSPPRVLDANAARAIVVNALDRAREDFGSLMVTTSPRTPPEAVAALKQTLAAAGVPISVAVFGEGGALYPAMLAAADSIIVTDDSAAMTAEAAMTGAPVMLHRLPRRPGPSHRRAELLRAAMHVSAPTRALFDAMVARGVITSIRDLDRYFARLEREGLLLGGDAARRRAAMEMQDAARRVRALAGVEA